MLVTFEAVDHAGRKVSDTLEASDMRAAMNTLRQRQLFITNMAPAEEGAVGATSSPELSTSSARMSFKQLSLFTRQTAMLLTSGTPVVPTLHSIAKQLRKPVHVQMVREITDELEDGSTLADALRKFPRSFDPAYCAIVAAGEATASLSDAFHRLAEIVGKRHSVRQRVRHAMIYPILLSVMSTGILQVLLFFVLPRFEDLFAMLGAPLPTITKVMLALSRFCLVYWPVVVVAALACIGGAVAMAITDRGRSLASRILEGTPIIGRVATGMLHGQTFRVLGTLIESHVGLLEAIDLVRGITKNKRFQALYSAMETEITSGGSLSRAMEGHVPSHYCQAVRTGEESGNLGAALNYVADILDEDNSEMIDTLTKLMEPAILIVMGVAVGLVAVSLFLPLFDVTSAIR